MNNTGIYKLYWDTCPYYYIGHNTNLGRRKLPHFSKLKKGDHCNSILQNVYNTHGDPSVEILEYCSKKDIYEIKKGFLEQAKEDPYCVNILFDPHGRGKGMSQEGRDKIRESNKSRVMSDITRSKFVGENNPNYGNTLGKNHMAKRVINTQTGEIYGCAKEVVEKKLVDMKYKPFIERLNGKVKINNTPFMYLDSH